MRISDWSSDVCSSDLRAMDAQQLQEQGKQQVNRHLRADRPAYVIEAAPVAKPVRLQEHDMGPRAIGPVFDHLKAIIAGLQRSEEHTSELQSLMRISYAVFCLKKQKKNNTQQKNI